LYGGAPDTNDFLKLVQSLLKTCLCIPLSAARRL